MSGVPQRARDLACDGGGRTAVGADGDGGDRAVERAAQEREFLEPGAPVGTCQQRPVSALARALELLLDRRVQEDDRAARGEPLAVLGQEHGPAASRKDDAGGRGQRVDHVALADAETLLALALENVGDVDARARLDLGIAIGEWQPEPPGQGTADRGLARAHRANQEDAALRRLQEGTVTFGSATLWTAPAFRQRGLSPPRLPTAVLSPKGTVPSSSPHRHPHAKGARPLWQRGASPSEKKRPPEEIGRAHV